MKSLGSLFDDEERKHLFKKYLAFLGWLEVLIFVITWLWQLGDKGYDRFGPIENPFPWKIYFLISFLAPVAVTFLLGIIIAGFNKYIADSDESLDRKIDLTKITGGKYHRAYHFLEYLRNAPFLALLLLLAIGITIFYNFDSIMSFITAVGEKSVRIGLMAGAVILGILSILGMIVLFLNYSLKKKSMDYQYKSQIARELGLIILDDNTVLDRDGKLLVKGEKWQKALGLKTKGSIKELPESESNDANKKTTSQMSTKPA